MEKLRDCATRDSARLTSSGGRSLACVGNRMFNACSTGLLFILRLLFSFVVQRAWFRSEEKRMLKTRIRRSSSSFHYGLGVGISINVSRYIRRVFVSFAQLKVLNRRELATSIAVLIS